MEPWSPMSNYSEPESTFGNQKPSTYLSIKMTVNGSYDYSSSSKEVLKFMPEKLKTDLQEYLKLVEERCNPDQNHIYSHMLKEADALHLRDANQEDVKDLRHFIPLFRKICYIHRDDIEKKFKLKSMWSERPLDWPREVQHVDPNNPGTAHGKRIPKPKKPELVKMFNHLTERYKTVRDELWRDCFGCHPDEECPATPVAQENVLVSSDLRSLGQQALKIYDDKKIGKLIATLIKTFDTIDTINNPVTWSKYNRQKCILEADLREVIFRHEKECSHATKDIIMELEKICVNVELNPEEILAVSEPEETAQQIPLIVDQARSPTNNQMRKRKPTLNFDDTDNEYEPTVPLFNYGFSLTTGPDDTVIQGQEMEVSEYVDISDGTNVVNNAVTWVDVTQDVTHSLTPVGVELNQAVDALVKAYPTQFQLDVPTDQVISQPVPNQPVNVPWEGDKEEPGSLFQNLVNNSSPNENMQMAHENVVAVQELQNPNYTLEHVAVPDWDDLLGVLLNDIKDPMLSAPNLSN